MKFHYIQKGDLLQFRRWRESEMKSTYGLIISDRMGEGTPRKPFFFKYVETNGRGGIHKEAQILRKADMNIGIRKVNIPSLKDKIKKKYFIECL